jgi:hypothetical protein
VSAPAVLVLAQTDDGAADLVMAALADRRTVVLRMDTADFPNAMSVAARPDRIDSPGWLDVRGERVNLATVRSVYRSHPAQFAFPEGMSGPERRFAMLESVYGLGGVFAAQQWRWLDRPGAVADASYKPHQLAVAAECCLNVPPSLVTHTVSPEATVDWRSRYSDLSYRVCSTPEPVRLSVLAYLRRFGLTFGAFDFSVTPDGRWWFLECNPAGRWGWIAEETGLPIADAIADELVSTA